MAAHEMRGLETLGVHELSELEQREVVGGGFWEKFGRIVGAFVANAFDAAEDFAAYVSTHEYENPKYNGTWQG